MRRRLGSVWRRTVIVVEDWHEVTEADAVQAENAGIPVCRLTA